MNKNRIKLWVDALRSGKYKQGKKALAKIGKNGKMNFCCLGVACEVARKNGLSLPIRMKRTGEDSILPLGTKVRCYDKEESMLPDKVKNWLGVPGLFSPEFVELNDERGFSFKRIADYIENVYLGPNSAE